MKMEWEYKITDTKFINPYNFVPVEYTKKSTGKLPSAEKQMTGVIHCSLYTRGPIAILDPKPGPEKIEGHAEYVFMKNTDEQYMIPASSIRGMIRSVHEVITDSCFSTVKKDSYITARSNSSYKPAVLIKEKNFAGEEVWRLYQATRYMLKVRENQSPRNNEAVWECPSYDVKQEKGRKYVEDSQGNKLYTGEKVLMRPLLDEMGENVWYYKKSRKCARVANSVKKWDENTKQGKRIFEGYLVLGENFSRKHHESVFRIDENGSKELKKLDQTMIDAAMERLKISHQVYNDAVVNRNLKPEQKWYGSFENMEKKGCIPVWYRYEKNNQTLYFSLASLGRMTYENTLSKLLRKKTACTLRENLCATCSVFGMVGEEEALGSRVRFLDAVCKNPSGKPEPITMKELAVPKPSYVPFYLKEKSRKQNREGEVIGYDNPNYQLRGRKFYWHSENPDLMLPVKKSKLNATVEILGRKKSEHFEFKVYFDGMTMEEVAALVYSLTLNENTKDGNLCHKAGHGKPLGLGSVKIVVDDILQRTYSPEKGYHLNPVTDSVFQKVSEWALGIEQKNAVKALKKMLQYNAATDHDVKYPYIIAPANVKCRDNDIASHKWFSKNYKMGTNFMDQILPDVLDSDQTLKAYQAKPVEEKRGRK